MHVRESSESAQDESRLISSHNAVHRPSRTAEEKNVTAEERMRLYSAGDELWIKRLAPCVGEREEGGGPWLG
ncbi:hypothetical protein SRHO_G00311800 [Serrasalmus rhombeus]